jgi:putative lipoprotein
MLPLLLIFHLNGPDHPAGDSWFGVDKVKHFFMGAFVQSVSYSAVRLAGARHNESLWLATGISTGVGLGKELWDRHTGGTPSAKDFTWDMVGAGASTLLLRRSVR